MYQTNWQHRSRRTAKKAGLSVSAFIEKAVEGLLGRSCLLVENSRLSKDLDQRGDRINELCKWKKTGFHDR